MLLQERDEIGARAETEEKGYSMYISFFLWIKVNFP